MFDNGGTIRLERDPAADVGGAVEAGLPSASTTLADPALIDAITACERAIAHGQARQVRLLAEFARRRPPDPVPSGVESTSVASRFAPDEIGVALTLARGTASGRIEQAVRLVAVLPATLDAWEAGRLDAAKVRAISDATVCLPDCVAGAVQDRVLHRAQTQTVAQLRAAVSRAIIAVDPDGAESRHRAARRDRRVVLSTQAEGMASLWATLPASDATSAYRWLTRLARGLGPDDPRGIDARRADLLTDLLCGRLRFSTEVGAGAVDPKTPHGGGTAAKSQALPVAPPPAKSLVHIVIGHDTLTGVADHPAELAGYGPIPASLAREIAADGVWKRLVADPLSGALLDHGRTTYHPPAGLADHVRARDVHCRFPTCRRRAVDAELDHTVAWEDGGVTSATNLHALCPHHHRLKHRAGWDVRAHPDGRLTWTTPTGHVHTSRPYDQLPEARTGTWSCGAVDGAAPVAERSDSADGGPPF